MAIDKWKPETKLPFIDFEIVGKSLSTNQAGEIKIMKCAGETVQLKIKEKSDICVGNNGSLISVKLNAGHNMRIIPINRKGGIVECIHGGKFLMKNTVNSILQSGTLHSLDFFWAGLHSSFYYFSA